MPDMFLLVATADRGRTERGDVKAIRTADTFSAYEKHLMQLVGVRNMTRAQITEAVESVPDPVETLPLKDRKRFFDFDEVIAAGDATVPTDGNRTADDTDVRDRGTQVRMETQDPSIMKVKP